MTGTWLVILVLYFVASVGWGEWLFRRMDKWAEPGDLDDGIADANLCFIAGLFWPLAIPIVLLTRLRRPPETKPIPDYKRIRALEEELGFAKPGDNQFILEATTRPKPSPRRFDSAGYGNPGFGNPWDTPRRSPARERIDR